MNSDLDEFNWIRMMNEIQKKRMVMNENIDIDYSYFQSINKQANKQKIKFYNNQNSRIK